LIAVRIVGEPMNITEQDTIEDLQRILKGQQASLEEYKKREAQQLNAVKEAIQKLSEAQAALQALSRPTSDVPPAWIVNPNCLHAL
jgi:vacuolar-type H+-ATPase subunit I/STV1